MLEKDPAIFHGRDSITVVVEIHSIVQVYAMMYERSKDEYVSSIEEIPIILNIVIYCLKDLLSFKPSDEQSMI